MKTLVLERYCYSRTETEGRLWLDDERFLYTLERPWRAGAPGGLRFESCVPDGTYRLQPHVRPNGDQVLALRNPSNHVYYEESEVPPEGGRYLILLHSANFVHEISGCIAPGISRAVSDMRPMVTSSRVAMKQLLETQPDWLSIRCACGTEED